MSNINWNLAEDVAGCKTTMINHGWSEPPESFCTTHQQNAEPCAVAESVMDRLEAGEDPEALRAEYEVDYEALMYA